MLLNFILSYPALSLGRLFQFLAFRSFSCDYARVSPSKSCVDIYFLFQFLSLRTFFKIPIFLCGYLGWSFSRDFRLCDIVPYFSGYIIVQAPYIIVFEISSFSSFTDTDYPCCYDGHQELSFLCACLSFLLYRIPFPPPENSCPVVPFLCMFHDFLIFLAYSCTT